MMNESNESSLRAISYIFSHFSRAVINCTT